ncbi:MAG: hypothetical protein AAGH92_08435 [Planctomycetota bacterium]
MYAPLIDCIRQRPAMFFDRKSLTALRHFHLGYQMGCCQQEVDDDRLLLIPSDFHDWVAYRTHYNSSTSGWCNMILETSGSEELAFDRFFELLDEHANREATVVARLRNSQRQFSSTAGTQNGEFRTYRFPASIALVTYTDDPGFFAISEVEGEYFPFQRFYPCLDWFESFVSPEPLEIVDQAAFAKFTRLPQGKDSID